MPPNIPDGRVFGFDSQTFISVGVHLFNLAVLAFAMSKLLYSPVREFLYSRAHRIDEQLRRVRDEKAEADKLKLEYEGLISNIGLEREAILEEARKEAASRQNQMISDTDETIKRMTLEARDEIAHMKAEARDEMRQAIIDASMVMAEKIVAHSLDPQAYESLFDRTISDLEESTWWK